ncbi:MULTISPECIES: polysaccharide biosynthesis/export family protein [unclassified Rhizobium]|uniref:polysaccharide biosynthesis/export family protein n=1 Tax=unclassified Rhizobium TaxID=2613769 RepID=UPI001048DDCF|nr:MULTISPECIES: polysaccharide biosynthesis/export family protein [unclassified Rhizobium]MBB3398027.1 exopolysaccharide production protein ExoF [Rhizobium sp. BK060]TCM70003.1 exopolysaccharide production protein ExoF [Rhizobium sp. BK068]
MEKRFLDGKSGRRRTLRSGIVVAAGLGAFLASSSLAAADDYRLGIMDKLKIRVAEWQTADGSIRDWSVVSGDYTVGPSGSISLPFVGDMPASGKTTDAIAQEIGSALQKQFALKDRPSASVELSEFRPVYLSGDVEKPGEYPFAPNLTIVKAVSLAGGLRRADAGQRFARDFINAKGDAVVYLADRARLLVKQARLRAEIANQDTIEMPKELQDKPEAKPLLASETALMNTRKKRLTLQLQALADLKQLLQSEVETLAKKTETQTRQLQLATEDRDKVEDLAERGLALSNRKMAAEQRAADTEATLLDIDTNSLKAKQDISKANQDEITLRNDWDAQLAQELQNAEAQLDELNLKLETSNSLMAEALTQSTDAARFDTSTGAASIAYSIVREVDGKAKEIPVQENTALQPGDLIKVTAGLAMR